jgi:hypothetical protein
MGPSGGAAAEPFTIAFMKNPQFRKAFPGRFCEPF